MHFCLLQIDKIYSFSANRILLLHETKMDHHYQAGFILLLVFILYMNVCYHYYLGSFSRSVLSS